MLEKCYSGWGKTNQPGGKWEEIDMEQKEYWNQAAKAKEFTTPFQMEMFEKYVKKEGRILDLGCGYGRVMKLLYEHGYRDIIGMDFSEEMIERGRREQPQLCFHVQQDAEIEAENESVDAVTLCAVLTCIADNEGQIKLLEEVRRVLKPGGYLYVNDFLLNEDKRNRERYAKFQEKYGNYGVFELPEGAVVRHHSMEWVRESLAAFEPVVLEETEYVTMNGNRSKGYYFLGRRGM